MTSPVGSLATEAALLLDAVAARLQAVDVTRTETASRSPSGCPQCGHDPSMTESCTACPLCRFLAVVKGERPETTARFVEGALTVVQALRAMLPVPADGTQGGSSGPGGSSDARGSSGDDAGTGGAAGPAQATADIDDSTVADPDAVRPVLAPTADEIDPVPRPTPDRPARSAPGALERIIVR